MSSQERTIVVSLISALICFAIYLYYMNDMYIAGDFSGAGAGALLGQSVFYLIGLSIIVSILASILVAIVNAAVTGENEKDLSDERDKVISLRGLQVSFIFFASCYISNMFALAWGRNTIFTIFLTICFMFASSVVGDLVKLYFYRRGL